MRLAGRIISVGGGKGGVGKSVVASNLAIALAGLGQRVVLVDGDLGAPNQHTLFGMQGRGPTLQDFLDYGLERLDEATQPTPVRGLQLIRGASGVAGAANPSPVQKQRLLHNLEQLPADTVLLDVGAGTAFDQLDLFDLADVKVLVSTAQLTSLENAYAFTKGMVYRALEPVLAVHGFEHLLNAPAGRAETTRLVTLLDEAVHCSPKLAAEVRAVLDRSEVMLFGNQVTTPAELGTFGALGRMMQDFLSISAVVLGVAPASRAIHESVNRRRPLLLEGRDDEASRSLRRLAHQLTQVGRRRPTAFPHLAA